MAGDRTFILRASEQSWGRSDDLFPGAIAQFWRAMELTGDWVFLRDGRSGNIFYGRSDREFLQN